MTSRTDLIQQKPWRPGANIRWHLHSAHLSLCGSARSSDEDCTLAKDRDGIFAVADGVGGYEGGAEASRFVCEALAEELPETDVARKFGIESARKALHHAVSVAVDGMARLAVSRPEWDHMSTTLAMGWVVKGRLFFAHAGDSRVYLIRNDEIIRLTDDHSFAEIMRQHSEVPADKLDRHPYRHMITRCIGPASDDIRLDVASLWLRPNDRLLLITDGITDVLNDRLLGALAAEIHGREQLCKALLTCARFCESPDDLSCVIVDCEAEDAGSAGESQWWNFKWLRAANANSKSATDILAIR